MDICLVCKKEITKDDRDLIRQDYDYLFQQADFWGFDAFDEKLQLLINFQLHDECYWEL